MPALHTNSGNWRFYPQPVRLAREVSLLNAAAYVHPAIPSPSYLFYHPLPNFDIVFGSSDSPHPRSHHSILLLPPPNSFVHPNALGTADCYKNIAYRFI
jgi:hypothetical protein